jgi:hypothetical protein
MAKKKVVPPKVEYEKISSQSCIYETILIPEGATHVEAELDYSSCYYENDTPSCIVHFFKKKEG